MPLPPWRRNQIAVTVAACLIFGGFTLVMPFLPYYVEEVGIRGKAVDVWSGVLLSVSPLLAAFDSFLFLPMTRRTFERAANLYRTLRRKGITIRNAVDCIIASVAIEHDIPLLHNDRDFNAIAALGDLKIVKTRGKSAGRSSVRLRRP